MANSNGNVTAQDLLINFLKINDFLFLIEEKTKSLIWYRISSEIEC